MAIVLADESQRLYEQIGALYARLQLGSEYGIGAIEEQGVEEFADLLGTVVKVADAARRVDRTDRALALYTAVRRYEADRTGPAAD